MRVKWLLGCSAVVCIATAAMSQDAPVRRPASGGLKPSAGAAPATSPAAKPNAGSVLSRPGTSAFSRTAAPASTDDGSASEPAPQPAASGFNNRSAFGGGQPREDNNSRFSSGETAAPAAGGFRSSLTDDTGDAAPDAPPLTNSFNTPSRTAPQPRTQPATQPATQPTHQNAAPATTYTPSSTRTVTPGGASSMSPRTFGSSATSSATANPPRNSLPSRSAPRVASATPVPVTLSTPTEAASPVAESLLKQALDPRSQHELPGQPVQLAQVIERSRSASQRIRAVQTYWKLVIKMAAYHAAVDDRNLFVQMNVRQLAAHDRSALAAAQSSAEAAVHRAELDFVTTQHELSEMAHFSDVDLQALPADVPLVSEYRTHFTTLYGGGSAPSGLRRLDRAMPYHLKNVRFRADSVVAAQQAIQATVEAVTTGQASMSTLLEVQQHYARERQAFAASVYDYNAMIAEYALNVAPNQPPATVVGMLIKTRPTTRTSTIIREDATIRTVGSEEPIPADHAPVLRSAHEGTLEPRQPSGAIHYQLDESAPSEDVIDPPAAITADESQPWRR